MSIPKDRLKSPDAIEPPLDERILDFLRRHSQEAFNLIEIFAAIEGFPHVDIAADFLVNQDELRQEAIISDYRNALGYLILERLVESGEHAGQGYYCAANG